MRNAELMISLLKEMSETIDGSMFTAMTLDADDEEIMKLHHADLLVDAGHAKRKGPDGIRITNEGYDFLNAIEKQEKVKKRFFELFDKGVPYVNAVFSAVDLAKKLID